MNTQMPPYTGTGAMPFTWETFKLTVETNEMEDLLGLLLVSFRKQPRRSSPSSLLASSMILRPGVPTGHCFRSFSGALIDLITFAEGHLHDDKPFGFQREKGYKRI